MTKVAIIVNLTEDEVEDPDHPMGITNDAYDRLTSMTEHGSPPLSWLGEIEDVKKV